MKTTISGILAALLGLMAFVATVPTDLQAMIMGLVPKPAQPYTALIFALAAFIARSYNAQASADAPTSKDSLQVQPPTDQPKTP